MAEDTRTLSTHIQTSVPLTVGLARNTFFNVAGWAVPAVLFIVTVPYIVSGLGTEGYGVYAIVTIAMGYVAMVGTPVASGNVRFMAEAYSLRDWPRLRESLFTGLVVNGAIAGAGAVLMFLTSDLLAKHVFKIPEELIDDAVIAFRMAAASVFLGAVAGALRGMPIAMRRYDVVAMVNAIVESARIGGIVLAIYLGGGLLGVVTAQLLSSALLAVCFGIIAWIFSTKLPASDRSSGLDKDIVKRLLSFSTLLFGGHVVAVVGYSIDMTIIGIMLGATATTFYRIPARLTDYAPRLAGSFLVTLYPLASESRSTGRLDELRSLYVRMMRPVFWLSALVSVMLIILSRDLLSLWVGPAIAEESWIVLVLLAASVIWRIPRSIAFQVIIGLGKAKADLVGSTAALLIVGALVVVLTPHLGISGAALAVLLGQAPIAVAYDVCTQRRLLKQTNWRAILSPYVRVGGAVLSTLAIAALFPVEANGWGSLIAKGSLFALVFFVISFAMGALQIRDIKFVLDRFRRNKVK